MCTVRNTAIGVLIGELVAIGVAASVRFVTKKVSNKSKKSEKKKTAPFIKKAMQQEDMIHYWRVQMHYGDMVDEVIESAEAIMHGKKL